jgi:hypothetical protein
VNIMKSRYCRLNIELQNWSIDGDGPGKVGADARAETRSCKTGPPLGLWPKDIVPFVSGNDPLHA